MLRYLSVGVIGALVIMACGSETPPSQFGTSSGTVPDAGGSIGFPTSDAALPPDVECKKMDILFVIDNSSSMDMEQKALAENIPGFIKLINEYKTAQGELLEYRIGILSTDANHDKGALQKKRGLDPTNADCNPGDVDKPWLERTDANVDASFACRARLGVLGDNQELPLEAARLALTERLADGTNVYKATNEPFLRSDALLAIVVITDEDEGGGDHDAFQPPAPKDTPAHYAGAFDNVKAGYRGRWATAVIAGESYCLNGQFGTADQAVRLMQFTDIAKPNSVFSSICSKDFTTSLKEAFDVFANACKGFPGVK